jgi:hypothetical protein
MEKNWQGLQNIMLYHATADSLAYIGEDSSLDLFFLCLWHHPWLPIKDR